MSIYNLYSKRNAKPCRGLIFDDIPSGCRLQIRYIIEDFFKKNYIEGYAEEHIWPEIQSILKRENQKEHLYKEGLHKSLGGHIASSLEVKGYLENEKDLNYVLNTIELIFTCIFNISEILQDTGYSDTNYTSSQAISDLNTRFKENCIGYRFENEILIRIDNELLYENVTKKVIGLLINPEYHNINDEYTAAHKRYREGDPGGYKDCIINCGRAFESTMKVICHKRGWIYSEDDTAKRLLDILFEKKFIPDYLKNHAGGLRALLEGGVPTIRNKESGHGAGIRKTEATDELAAYTLDLTGSTIKFFISLLEKRG